MYAALEEMQEVTAICENCGEPIDQSCQYCEECLMDKAQMECDSWRGMDKPEERPDEKPTN